MRVKKDDALIAVVGEIDEFSCTIGLFSSMLQSETGRTTVLSIQKNMYVLSGQLSLPTQPKQKITQQDIQKLEASIDALTNSLPPLRDFIIPGGPAPVPQIHFSRAVCRRMERALCQIDLVRYGADAPVFTAYVNRVSDYLFTLARQESALRGERDVAAKLVSDPIDVDGVSQ